MRVARWKRRKAAVGPAAPGRHADGGLVGVVREAQQHVVGRRSWQEAGSSGEPRGAVRGGGPAGRGTADAAHPRMPVTECVRLCVCEVMSLMVLETEPRGSG